MKFKVGDKVVCVKNGTVGVVTDYWGGRGYELDVPYPYRVTFKGITRDLYSSDELKLAFKKDEINSLLRSLQDED